MVACGWRGVDGVCPIGAQRITEHHSGDHVARLCTRGTSQWQPKTCGFDLTAPDCSSNHHLAARLPVRHQRAAGSSSRDQHCQGRLENTRIREKKGEKTGIMMREQVTEGSTSESAESCSAATRCHFYSLQKKCALLTCQSKQLDYLCASLLDRMRSDTPEMRKSKTLVHMF